MLLNHIDKTILESSDVQNINPNRDLIKKIDQATASDLQLVIFDYDEKLDQTHIITTNNKPQEISIYISTNYPKNKIYYTDDIGFGICLNRYNIANMKQDKIDNIYSYEQSVK